MRIRSSVTPTPIVSVTTQNQPAETPVQTAPTPVRVDAEPMTVDLGDKIIQLQPGELAKVVEKVNQTAQVFNHALEFQIHDNKQIVIRVVDTASGQILREIPPERFMDAFQRMEDALGLLLDLKM